MSGSGSEGFLLSRQPIAAADGRSLGWALRIATPEGVALSPTPESSTAYAAAIEACFRSARWDSFLCGGRALIAADSRLIRSEVIECVPRERALLGLAPGEAPEVGVIRRLRDLYDRRGTRVLLSGYSRKDPREVLQDLVEIAEVDAFAGDANSRGMLIRRAKRRQMSVLASNVQTGKQMHRLAAEGFELFTGESFAAPESTASEATDDGRALLQLLIEARGELEIETVTRRIEEKEALAVGLLRLVNSLELARAQKIQNVGQALIMIGANGLSRWLLLLLFQMGSRHGTRGPLFRVAASRARLMELVAASASSEEAGSSDLKARGELAFLTGILSFVHVLLGVSPESAMANLTLDREIRDALTGEDPEISRVLALAKSLDDAAFPEAAEHADALGLDWTQLWQCQQDAFEWVMQIT